jgi:hypothetical protein
MLKLHHKPAAALIPVLDQLLFRQMCGTHRRCPASSRRAAAAAKRPARRPHATRSSNEARTAVTASASNVASGLCQRRRAVQSTLTTTRRIKWHTYHRGHTRGASAVVGCTPRPHGPTRLKRSTLGPPVPMSKVTHMMVRSVNVRFRTLRILIAVRPHTERVRIARPEKISRRIVQRQQRQSRLPAATKLSRSDMDVVVVLKGKR